MHVVQTKLVLLAVASILILMLAAVGSQAAASVDVESTLALDGEGNEILKDEGDEVEDNLTQTNHSLIDVAGRDSKSHHVTENLAFSCRMEEWAQHISLCGNKEIKWAWVDRDRLHIEIGGEDYLNNRWVESDFVFLAHPACPCRDHSPPQYFHMVVYDHTEYDSITYYVKRWEGSGKFSLTTSKRQALRFTTKGDRRLVQHGSRNTIFRPSRHGCTSNWVLSAKTGQHYSKALRMWFSVTPDPLWEDEPNSALCV